MGCVDGRWAVAVLKAAEEAGDAVDGQGDGRRATLAEDSEEVHLGSLPSVVPTDLTAEYVVQHVATSAAV